MAGVDCQKASERVTAARLELADRVDAAADLSERLAEVGSALETEVAECQQLEAERRDFTTESAALRTGLDELLARLGSEQGRYDELESSRLVLEAAESEQREETLRISVARADIRRTCKRGRRVCAPMLRFVPRRSTNARTGYGPA